MDGCILYNPPKVDVLKVYVDTFNLEILIHVQTFWKNSYDHISNTDIVNLGCLLYEHEEKLVPFGVHDPNLTYSKLLLY